MENNLLVHNAVFADGTAGWITCRGCFVHQVGHGQLPKDICAADVVDAGGALLLPGAIDCHVHFRQPGMTDRADIATESRAAAAGGVTSFLDMPNTKPPTVSVADVMSKKNIAATDSVVNYGFFIGATNSNIREILAADFSEIPGIKLFMGSSTGNMLVDDDESLKLLFSKARVPISVHAEDEHTIEQARMQAIARFGSPEAVPVEFHSRIRSAEACVRATRRAISLAQRYGAHLHIAHVSTADEVEMIRQARLSSGAKITCEVSPHHLLFCSDDYARLGTRIKMNPAVKSMRHRDALRAAIADGTIDIIATDHAPHLPGHKQGGALTAASGAPFVQFSVAAMLTLFDAETVHRCMCRRPVEIFGIKKRGVLQPGMYADFALWHNEKHTVTDLDVLSKCGWTPLHGSMLEWRNMLTAVNGRIVTEKAPASAMPLQFRHI